MSTTQLYKTQLLDHFKKPRNKVSGDLTAMQFVKRGANPRCGDDIEIGFSVTDSLIDPIQFRGRGCSVCIASASMMTEAIAGKSVADAAKLAQNMQAWIEEGKAVTLPDTLQPLEAVRHHPARKKCVMLAWHALRQGMEQCNG
ncbi:SUF system NifU family Fe-S cluster assembly protein [Glaciecola sp. XM2]|jgi:nitrogen fixation NifU-like protein|uniref:Fe-S cluster assembly sulfur transfer protein SufU n=1 Tax=Glaciecola sp. XM2 TaxID=1914931 RepID=UPI001BDE22B8|nr:SUF system NifU family Fe-S cluster assembly protein [Glaciecola sp. XM2]MBT1450006.1 SUF system NifU family Fe-S cluster assembly protein [Glaciecola sp. XM2]